ncbi:APC family permease [Prauserella endophytica]|uniref:APC family permease n=1 Tax=Prauserella endophytica TaxID=1592324 RepID=A0ABY2S7T7_9PSEU|nr:APC family permease [Prauserella endophytica]TKG71687.1 APC family permease [Prauserella endophytica]
MTASGAPLERKLTWRDSFALSLLVPVSIFAAIAPSMGAVGTWTLMLLFAVVCTVGILQGFIYTELAAMFPDKSGGVAVYAHEGWRKYCTPLGAIVAFGYWAGWSFGVAVMALGFGSVLHAEFFPSVTWSIDLGAVDATLTHVLAVFALVLVSWLNLRGIEVTAMLAKILGVFAVALILLFAVGPIVTGNFDLSGLTWQLPGGWEGWHTALAFLFLLAWSSYALEMCAIFTPEYKDPLRDTRISLRAAGLVTLAASVLAPMGIAGVLGDETVAADPDNVYAAAFGELVGQASSFVAAMLALSFLLVMNGATADSGRALYGVARAGMTLRQLEGLNSGKEPAPAILVAMVANIALVLFVGNPLGIIFAGNVGYILTHLLAIAAFLLLRRDRPELPRPVRLGRVWVLVAWLLIAFNATILVVGVLSPGATGYGGTAEQLIGAGILLVGLLFLGVRRRQDARQRLPSATTIHEPESTR